MRKLLQDRQVRMKQRVQFRKELEEKVNKLNEVTQDLVDFVEENKNGEVDGRGTDRSTAEKSHRIW